MSPQDVLKNKQLSSDNNKSSNTVNRTKMMTEQEAEEAAKADLRAYQKNKRVENRKKVGLLDENGNPVEDATNAKTLQSFSYEELEEFRQSANPSQVRVVTQSSKMNLYEIALLRQAILITGKRSARELLIDQCERIVNEHNETN